MASIQQADTSTQNLYVMKLATALHILLTLLLLTAALPLKEALGQGLDRNDYTWTSRLRLVVSSNSYESDPDGFRMYSGIGIEAGITRRLTDRLGLDAAFRTESREVEGPENGPGDHRLGSVELIPMTLSLRWQPLGHQATRVQPYLGAGVALTAIWEKSGVMEGAEIPPSVDPLVQLGLDFEMTEMVLLHMDIKWNTLKLNLEDFRDMDPSVSIHPLTMGLGFGFRF